MWPFKKKSSPQQAKPRPELKRFRDLRPDDFARHPVWLSCHSVDYDEPWYSETNEETFRPHAGSLPVDTDQMYLVRCVFELSSGEKLDGFATPAADAEDWGTIQPQVFAFDGKRYGFWLGMSGKPGVAADFCRALGKTPDSVFPIRFGPMPGLTSGECAGCVRGFMTRSGASFVIATD